LAHLAQNKVGVILSDTRHRALFLPQVWQQLPEPDAFIRHLKHKAGWPADYWSANIEVQFFDVDSAELAYSNLYP
jgi:AMMECR1 domain-containing protein